MAAGSGTRSTSDSLNPLASKTLRPCRRALENQVFPPTPATAWTPSAKMVRWVAVAVRGFQDAAARQAFRRADGTV